MFTNYVVYIFEVCTSYSEWNGKDKNFLSQYVKLTEFVPSYEINDVHDNVIVPKLLSQIEQRKSLNILDPIHLWVYPWLPYLSKL